MIKSFEKLIEVALPLDDINAPASRERSIRHRQFSTLHLWWARQRGRVTCTVGERSWEAEQLAPQGTILFPKIGQREWEVTERKAFGRGWRMYVIGE